MAGEIKPFKTKDMGFAAYLHLSGIKALRTIPGKEPWQQYFVFVKDDKIDELSEIYFTKEKVLISPSEYYWAMRDMKRLLQDPWSPDE